MIAYFKKDYQSVKAAAKLLTNDRMPNWAIVCWYIIAAPFGLLIYPFGKIYLWWVLRSLK